MVYNGQVMNIAEYLNKFMPEATKQQGEGQQNSGEQTDEQQGGEQQNGGDQIDEQQYDEEY